MKEKKHIESVVHNFESIVNVGNNLNQLNDELSKELMNDQEDKINLKKTLLDNLNISNRMFDKYSNIIFDDIELRKESEQLFKRLSNYFI